MNPASVRTTRPYCGVGCGVIARRETTGWAGLLPTRRDLRPTWSEYIDKHGALFRAAATDADGALAEAVLAAPPGKLPARDWLLALLASGKPPDAVERPALLSGRAPVPIPIPSIGRIVCSCFTVGLNQIRDAVGAGCASVDDIGRALRAGTNCGSCRTEIKGVIDASHRHATT